MKIGVILHPYGEAKTGGLGRCMFEWTKSLLEADADNDYIVFLKDAPKESPALPGKWDMAVLGGGFLWQNRLLKEAPCDVYLFQTPILPLQRLPGKTIIMVQDFPYKYFKAGGMKDFFFQHTVGMVSPTLASSGRCRYHPYEVGEK